jgi:hypothetical protein
MKNLDVVTVGFGHSAKAYADEKGAPVTHAPAPILSNHHFSISAGELLHAIDGQVRARVPRGGMREYAESWPDCAALVKSLLGQPDALAPGAKPATVVTSAKRKGRQAKTRA